MPRPSGTCHFVCFTARTERPKASAPPPVGLSCVSSVKGWTRDRVSVSRYDSVFSEKLADPLGHKHPLGRNFVDCSGAVSSRPPNFLLVEDCVSSAGSARPQPVRHFSRGGKIHPRECVQRYTLELDEAEYCFRPVASQPLLNCSVVIRVFQVRLCETPTSVLAAFDGYLEEALAPRDNQVILRLICPVLDGHVISKSCKLGCRECLCSNPNVPTSQLRDHRLRGCRGGRRPNACLAPGMLRKETVWRCCGEWLDRLHRAYLLSVSRSASAWERASSIRRRNESRRRAPSSGEMRSSCQARSAQLSETRDSKSSRSPS